ncbi:MAG: secreted protein [Marmoricola sp.]|nr:secreted protein [Marmoricola sp.]
MPAAYHERLHVPLRWWVQATMFLATVWLAFIVALPAWLAWGGSLALLALVYGLFAWVGSAHVAVRDGTLYAGDATISLDFLGTPEPLDKEGTRRVHGVDADARAYLLMRPYLSRSVRVPIVDPSDPTPYWLISTRHPRRLAKALTDHRIDQRTGDR